MPPLRTDAAKCGTDGRRFPSVQNLFRRNLPVSGLLPIYKYSDSSEVVGQEHS